MFNFAVILPGMKIDRGHLFTIKDTPRLPRELWEHFRAAAASRDDTTIDALRRALELYIAQEPAP